MIYSWKFSRMTLYVASECCELAKSGRLSNRTGFREDSASVIINISGGYGAALLGLCKCEPGGELAREHLSRHHLVTKSRTLPSKPEPLKYWTVCAFDSVGLRFGHLVRP
jgi:hypothetical protein